MSNTCNGFIIAYQKKIVAAMLRLKRSNWVGAGKAIERQLFGCDDESMQLGMAELKDDEALRMSGIRRPGGGRKSAMETIAGIDAAFLKVIAQHTAGSPMDETVKWTNLTRQEIAQLLEHEGIARECHGRRSTARKAQLLLSHCSKTVSHRKSSPTQRAV